MLETVNVSYSRLQSLLKCPWSYYCKYALKLQDPGNDKARLGNCLHEILELIACPSKQKPRKKYILYSRDTKELHPAINRLYIKFLKKYNVIQFYGKDQMDLHEYGQKILVKTFVKVYDASEEVIDVERGFTLKVSDRIYIKGFIDKICKYDKDTIIITDYKTGQPFNVEKCSEETQPIFYKLAAMVLYKEYKNIIFAYHFLKNSKIITVTIEEDRLKNYLKFIIAQGKRMLNFTEKDATPCKNWLCSMCAFKYPNEKNNYPGCPAFYDKVGESIFKQ